MENHIIYSSINHKGNNIIKKNNRRRVHIIRKNITVRLAILTAIITVFISLSGFCIIHASGSQNEQQQPYKYYDNIEVMPNDTLWSISEKYHEKESINKYLTNIKEMNNLSDNDIYAGQYLLVYYYSYELK